LKQVHINPIIVADIMANIPGTFSTVIGRPPSCVEFLPSNASYIFIGTYALNEKNDGDGAKIRECSESKASPQKRSGSVVIMRLK
jgi:hypothetical protein